MGFFRDTLAGALNRWPVKVLVLLVFGVYLAGACYGITTMKEGLQRRKLSHATSYSIEFYDREDIYFREFPFRIQVGVVCRMTSFCWVSVLLYAAFIIGM